MKGALIGFWNFDICGGYVDTLWRYSFVHLLHFVNMNHDLMLINFSDCVLVEMCQTSKAGMEAGNGNRAKVNCGPRTLAAKVSLLLR